MSLSSSSSIETCDVFVYGTLRHGEINDIALAAMRFGRPDLPAPRHVAVGRVPGHLVDFGDWPGLVPPHGADTAGKTARCATVRGDVFRIDRALLSILDEIEGIRPNGRGAFYRSEIDVIPDRPTRADSSEAHAAAPAAPAAPAETTQPALRCVYYPIDPEAGRGRPPIFGGDWIVHRLARSR